MRLVHRCCRCLFGLIAFTALSLNIPLASAQWPHEWVVDDFSFHADFEAARDAALMGELRHLKRDISSLLGLEIKPEPIHIILFSRNDTYREYLKEHFPNLPDRRAMYIKRRGPGMVFAYNSRELDVDLRHESTHALLNASLQFLPLWLDEGIAEYFEVESAKRFDKSAHLKVVRLRVILGQVGDLQALEDLGDLADMNGGHYRDAWSWVHFLIHESDQSRAILTRYLEDIQSGILPGPLSRRVAVEMPDHKARYLRHFRAIY